MEKGQSLLITVLFLVILNINIISAQSVAISVCQEGDQRKVLYNSYECIKDCVNGEFTLLPQICCPRGVDVKVIEGKTRLVCVDDYGITAQVTKENENDFEDILICVLIIAVIVLAMVILVIGSKKK